MRTNYDENNPQDILIEELKKSRELFNSLSTVINNNQDLRVKTQKSIENVNELIEYIDKSNIFALEDLLIKFEEFREIYP